MTLVKAQQCFETLKSIPDVAVQALQATRMLNNPHLTQASQVNHHVFVCLFFGGTVEKAPNTILASGIKVCLQQPSSRQWLVDCAQEFHLSTPYKDLKSAEHRCEQYIRDLEAFYRSQALNSPVDNNLPELFDLNINNQDYAFLNSKDTLSVSDVDNDIPVWSRI